MEYSTRNELYCKLIVCLKHLLYQKAIDIVLDSMLSPSEFDKAEECFILGKPFKVYMENDRILVDPMEYIFKEEDHARLQCNTPESYEED